MNYYICLETSGHIVVLGDKECKLLKIIDETSSLSNAVSKLGLTYRKTWGLLRNIENELGFSIIKPTRGGAKGGSTLLTLEGEILLAAFEKFHQEYDSIILNGFEIILKELKQKCE